MCPVQLAAHNISVCVVVEVGPHSAQRSGSVRDRTFSSVYVIL